MLKDKLPYIIHFFIFINFRCCVDMFEIKNKINYYFRPMSLFMTTITMFEIKNEKGKLIIIIFNIIYHFIISDMTGVKNIKTKSIIFNIIYITVVKYNDFKLKYNNNNNIIFNSDIFNTWTL